MTTKMFTQKVNFRIGAILALLILSLFFWESAFADLPQQIFFQAKITTTGGTIVTGTHSITFRLYEASGGGSTLWTETQSLTADSSGIISCYLGGTAAFPLTMDFNDAYYLSIEVDSDGEMSPRIKIVPSFSALNSERFDGLNSTQFLRSDTADTMEAAFTLTSYLSQNYTGTANNAMTVTFNPASGNYNALDITYGSAGGTGTALKVTQSGSGDILRLFGGSTGVFAVKYGGNVGIGTTNPASLLDVNSKFNVLSGGNVGIGTASPVSLLDVNSKFNVLSGGNVGIGVVSPSARLDIKSAGATTGLTLRIQDSSGTNKIAILDNGNVGIGTTSPSNFNLEMAGSIGPAADSTYDLGTNTVRWANIYADNLYGNVTPIGLVSGGIIFANGEGALTQDISNLYWNNTDNLMGIGTSSPTSGLTIGSGSVDHSSGTPSNDVYVTGNLEVDGSTWLGDASADTLTVMGTLSAANVDMTINNITVNGNTILGDGAADSLTVNASTLSLANASTLDLASSVRALNIESGLLNLDTQNAKIGVGTTAPTAGITVGTGTNDNATSASDVYITGRLEVDGSTWLGDAEADTLTVTGTLSAVNTNMSLQTLTVSGNTFLATATGNVGIGTSSPGALLAVGNDAFKVTSTGTITAGTWNGSNINDTYIPNDITIDGTNNVTWASVNKAGSSLADLITRSAGDLTSGNLAVARMPVSGNWALTGNLGITGGNLGVGTTAPTAGITVGTGTNDNATSASDVYITGRLEVDGSTWLGDAQADTLTVTGTLTATNVDMTVNNVTVNNDLVVNGDTTLGNAAGDTLTLNAATLTLANASIIDIANALTTSLNIESGLFNLDTQNTRVGIGTTAPVGLLQVGTSPNAPLVVNAGGNVGIGTTGPNYNLEVSSTGYFGGDVKIGTGTFNNASPSPDVYVTGNLEVDGSSWLGDAAADSLTVIGTFNATGADMTVNDLTVNGNTVLGDNVADTVTITASTLTLANAKTVNLVNGSTTALNIESGLLNLDTQNAKLGVGTTAPTAGITVGTGTNDNATSASDVYITGRLEVDGSTWLGDAQADTLTVTGTLTATNVDMTVNNVTVNNDLVVNGDTTLGNAAGDTLTLNAATLTLANAKTIDLVNASSTALNVESGLLNLDTQNTRVGIGTTAPGARLDVVDGSIRTNNQLISTVAPGTAPLSVTSNTLVSNLNADLLDGESGSYYLAAGNISGITNYVSKFTDTSSLGISSIFDNGNVGIGTTNPNLAKLTLQGAATIATTPSATDSDGTIYIGKSVESDADHAPSNGSEYLMWDDNYVQGAKTGWFYFSGPVSMSSLNVRNPSSISFGTGTPQTVSYDATGGTSGTGAFTFSKEIITESSSPAYLTFAKSGGDTLYSLAFNPDVTPKTLQLLSKNVGVGTTAPLFEFDTQGSFSVFDSLGNKKTIISTGTNWKINPQNLIRSGSFETMQPTGWSPENGAVIGTNLDIGTTGPGIDTRFGVKYLRIKDTSTGASYGASFFIPGAARFRGGNLTLSIFARAASGTQNAAVGYQFDNDPIVVKKLANLSTTWTNSIWTLPETVPATCSSVKFYLFGNNGTTGNTLDVTQTNSDWVFFDGVSLVEGNLAVDFGPSPITDTGDQVMYGNLAIGAGFDPYQSGNYYAAPRITFGEPDSYYGTGYGGYGMGAGEIRFLQWGGYDAGRFEFNRPIRIFDAMSSTYGASFMVNTEAGAGPTTANQKGDAYVSGRIEIGGTAPGTALIVGTAGGGVSIDNAINRNDAYIKGNLEVDGTIYGALSSTSSTFSSITVTGNGYLATNAGANVGIGTTNPSQRLHIAGNMRLTGALYDNYNQVGVSGQVLSTTETGVDWIDISDLPAGDANTLDGIDSTGFLRSNVSTSFGSTAPGGTLTISSGATLSVAGDLSVADTSIALTGASVDLDTTGNLSVNTDQLFVKKTSGNVGIGTTAPNYALEVASTGYFGGDLKIGTGAFNNASGAADLYVTGNIEVDGSSWLGDAAADTLTVVGTFNATNTSMTLQTLSVTGDTVLGDNTSDTLTVNAGNLILANASTLNLANASTTALNIESGLLNLDTQNARVGIGTISPAALLQVGTSPNAGLIVTASGNVGIGTTVASTRLHVSGGGVRIDDMASGGFVKNDASGNLSGGNSISAGDIPTSNLVNGTGISMAGTLTNRLVGSGDNITVNVSSAVPTSVTDDTNVTGSITNNVLTLGWSGQLGVSRGGTGANSLTGVLKGNGANAVTAMTGTSNYAARWTDTNTLGTGKLYDNATNVGIGTTAPQGLLHVGTVPSSGLIVQASGNVGIGTTNPAGLLTINRSTEGNFLMTTTGGNSRHVLTTDGSANALIRTGNNVDLRLGVNEDAITIKNGGNVGIGTTNPGNYKLYVNGDTYIGGITVTNGSLSFGGALDMQTNLITNIGNANTDFTSGGGLVLAGNVGIGTTNPTYKLDVKGTSYFGGLMQLDGNSIAGVVELYSQNAAGSTLYLSGDRSGIGDAVVLRTRNSANSPTPRITVGGYVDTAEIDIANATLDLNGNNIYSSSGNLNLNDQVYISGNVGIGTTNPQAPLEVKGTSDDNLHIQSPDYPSLTFKQGLTKRWKFQVNGGAYPFLLTDVTNNKTPLTVEANAGDNLLYLKSGNVGIGTTAPNYALEVASTGYFGGDLKIGTGTFNNASGSADLYVTGNIEVDGSTWLGDAEADTLTVSGSFNATNTDMVIRNLTVNDNTVLGSASGDTLTVNAGALTLTNASTLNLANNSTTALNIESGLLNLDTQNTRVGIGTATPLGLLQVGTSPNAPLLVTASGNVGIGTTGPGSGLQVGTTASSHSLTAANDVMIGGKLEVDGTTFFDGWTYGSTHYFSTKLYANSTAASIESVAADDGYLTFQARDNGTGQVEVARLQGAADPYFKAGSLYAMYSGNVGIGTTAPNYALEVASTGYFGGDLKIGTGTFNNASGAADVYVTGNLEVDGSSWLGDAGADSLTVTGTLSAANADMTLNSLTVNGNTTLGSGIEDSITINADALTLASATTIDIANASSTSLNIESGLLNLDTQSARVGIGNTAPAVSLDVTGNARASQVQVDSATIYIDSSSNNMTFTDPTAGTVNLVDLSGGPGGGGSAPKNATYITQTPNNTLTNEQALSTLATGYMKVTTTSGVISSQATPIPVGDGGTGASSLTGVLKGNGANALTAMTGTQNYITRWTDANTLGVGILYDDGTKIGIGTTEPLGLLQVGTSPNAPLLVTQAGKVGIGNTSPQAGLTVGIGTNNNANTISDVYIAGKLEVDGSTWLGDAAADTLTVVGTLSAANADMILNSLTVNGNTTLGSGIEDSITINADALTLANATTIDITNASTTALNIESGLLNLDTQSLRVGIGTTAPLGLLQVGTSPNAPLLVLATGKVGIGNTSPQAGLTVGIGTNNNANTISDVYIAGKLEVDGSTWLGDAGADTLTVTGTLSAANASLTISDLTVNGNTTLGTGIEDSITVNADALTLANATTIDIANASTTSLNIESGLLNLDTQNLRVGVGTAAPLGLLQVGTSPNAPLLVLATGKVGIGNTSPQAGLTVGIGTNNNANTISDVYIAGKLEVDGSTWLGDAAADTLTVVGTLSAANADMILNSLTVNGNTTLGTGTEDSITINADALTLANATTIDITNASSTSLNIESGLLNLDTQSLRVGIGTTNPQYKLEVSGQGYFTDTITAAKGTGDSLVANNNVLIGGNLNLSSSSNPVIDSSNSALRINTGANRQVWFGTGNIGIGTTAPSGELTVQGGGDGEILAVKGTYTGNYKIFEVKQESNDGMVYVRQGDNSPVSKISGNPNVPSYLMSRVGIGTTDPLGLLQVGTSPNAPLLVLATGKVGIGNTSPQAGLTVGIGTNNNANTISDVYIAGKLEVDGSTWLGDAGADTLTVTGTLSAANASLTISDLTVNGNTTLGTGTEDSITINADALTLANATTIDIANASTTSLNIESGLLNLDTQNLRVGVGTAAPLGLLQVGTSPNAPLLVLATGKVGIGNTSPQAGLTVGIGTNNNANTISDVYIAGKLEVDGSTWLGDAAADTLTVTGTLSAANADMTLNSLTVNGNTTLGSGIEDSITINADALTLANVSTIDIANASTTALNIESGLLNLDTQSLRVGIGTTAPQNRLDIVSASGAQLRLSYDATNSATITAENDGDLMLSPKAGSYLRTLNPFSFGGGTIYMNNGLIQDIGSSDTDFTSGGGLNVSGNVGIGTTNPQSPLEVAGYATINKSGGSSGYLRILDSSNSIDVMLDAGGTTWFSGGSVGIGTSAPLGLLQVGTSPNAPLLVLSTGKVGIGNTSPQAGLTVGIGTNNNANTISDVYIAGKLEVDGSAWLGDAAADTLTVVGTLTATNASMTLKSLTVTDGAYLATTTGNVGIGTASPTLAHIQELSSNIANLQLEENNGGSAAQILLKNTARTWDFGADSTPDGFYIHLSGGNQDFLFINPSGNVGIGTTNPLKPFHVTTNGRIGNIQIENADFGAAGTGIGMWSAGAGGTLTLQHYNNAITFETGTGSNPTEWMRITSTGNVGIGTTDPGAKLEINGGHLLVQNGKLGVGVTPGASSESLEVSGSIKLTGRIRQGTLGDLAEMMPLASCVINPHTAVLDTPEALAKGENDKTPLILKNKKEYRKYVFSQPEAGDVVAISEEDGGIRRSYEPFATNVVGIISTNPAQVLRDGLENGVPVVLSGIVPCKVTAENGQIKPGDLLVSSSTPGHAMKAGKNAPQGTVIGKALTRLDGDVGVVDVIAMMQ